MSQPTNHTIAAILRKTAEYLRSGWVQDMLAADEHDRPVDYASPLATRWCLVGAMSLAAMDYTDREFEATLRAFKQHVGSIWAADWNNAISRTAESVVSTVENLANRLSEGVIPVP